MTTRDFLSRAVSRAVGGVWGEAIRLTPITPSDYAAAITDPERPAADVRGIVSIEQRDTDLQGGRRGTQMQGTTYVATRATRVYLRPEVIEGLGYTIRKDDFATLLDRSAGQHYRVVHTMVLDGGETLLDLTLSDATPPASPP